MKAAKGSLGGFFVLLATGQAAQLLRLTTIQMRRQRVTEHRPGDPVLDQHLAKVVFASAGIVINFLRAVD